jgi:hypothetical protein
MLRKLWIDGRGGSGCRAGPAAGFAKSLCLSYDADEAINTIAVL